MNSIETLATFFGWCTVINFGVLLVGGLLWILVKEGIGELVATIFGVTKGGVKETFSRGLIQYRTAILMLNLVPYIALKIMT